jgi:hypothetical protein
MIDNAIETKKATVGSLSSCFAIADNFNNLSTTVNSLSAILSGYLKVQNISTTYYTTLSNVGALITYNGTSDITLYITPDINITGFQTAVTQLGSGTVTIIISPS